MTVFERMTTGVVVKRMVRHTSAFPYGALSYRATHVLVDTFVTCL